mgnify:CR=1 FL=1
MAGPGVCHWRFCVGQICTRDSENPLPEDRISRERFPKTVGGSIISLPVFLRSIDEATDASATNFPKNRPRVQECAQDVVVQRRSHTQPRKGPME